MAERHLSRIFARSTRAGHRHRDIVGREIVLAVAQPLADNQRGDETGDARGDMNDGASGEIEQARALKKTAAPHPVCNRDINEDQPKRGEAEEG